MNRLLLNNDNHFENKIKLIDTLTTVNDYTSHEEKIRTAKDILYFMYPLNKDHVISQLKGQKMLQKTLKNG